MQFVQLQEAFLVTLQSYALVPLLGFLVLQVSELLQLFVLSGQLHQESWRVRQARRKGFLEVVKLFLFFVHLIYGTFIPIYNSFTL